MTDKSEEQKFRDSIDCDFPYTDRSQAEALINQASTISEDAVLAVIYELCYPGSPNPVSKHPRERLELLQLAADQSSYPLKSLIINTAQRLIRDEELSVQEAVEAMRKISKYPDEPTALNILYFSCDDVDNIADKLYKEIEMEWHTKI